MAKISGGHICWIAIYWLETVCGWDKLHYKYARHSCVSSFESSRCLIKANSRGCRCSTHPSLLLRETQYHRSPDGSGLFPQDPGWPKLKPLCKLFLGDALAFKVLCWHLVQWCATPFMSLLQSPGKPVKTGLREWLYETTHFCCFNVAGWGPSGLWPLPIKHSLHAAVLKLLSGKSLPQVADKPKF